MRKLLMVVGEGVEAFFIKEQEVIDEKDLPLGTIFELLENNTVDAVIRIINKPELNINEDLIVISTDSLYEGNLFHIKGNLQ